MTITELFNPTTAYPIKWNNNGPAWNGLAKGPDGVPIEILFNPVWGPENPGFIEIIFARNEREDISGEGNALAVFATVIAAIDLYVSRRSPDYLTFSASGASRVKLYNALVRRLGTRYKNLPENEWPNEMAETIKGAGDRVYLLKLKPNFRR